MWSHGILIFLVIVVFQLLSVSSYLIFLKWVCRHGISHFLASCDSLKSILLLLFSSWLVLGAQCFWNRFLSLYRDLCFSGFCFISILWLLNPLEYYFVSALCRSKWPWFLYVMEKNDCDECCLPRLDNAPEEGPSKTTRASGWPSPNEVEWGVST